MRIVGQESECHLDGLSPAVKKFRAVVLMMILGMTSVMKMGLCKITLRSLLVVRIPRLWESVYSNIIYHKLDPRLTLMMNHIAKVLPPLVVIGVRVGKWWKIKRDCGQLHSDTEDEDDKDDLALMNETLL